MPGRRKSALQPWAGLELGPKELAAQRRVAPAAALLGGLVRDETFVANVWAVRASFGERPEYNGALALVGFRPQLIDEVAGRYVKRAGYARDVMAHVLAKAVNLQNPLMVLTLSTRTVVFVDEDLTDEDPRHWPHAKRWHEAGLVLAAVGAGKCPHLVERGGRLEACGTVPGRLGEDGRQRRYCSRHQPQTKFEKSSDRADREAVTNLLHAAGEALGVPRARNTAAA